MITKWNTENWIPNRRIIQTVVDISVFSELQVSTRPMISLLSNKFVKVEKQNENYMLSNNFTATTHESQTHPDSCTVESPHDQSSELPHDLPIAYMEHRLIHLPANSRSSKIQRKTCVYCSILKNKYEQSYRTPKSSFACEICDVALCRKETSDCFINFHKCLLKFPEFTDKPSNLIHYIRKRKKMDLIHN